jgi:hypothetical protein
MKDVESVVARLYARQRGRAVAIRDTSAWGPDPSGTVGIATIRVVTEDHVQALAFGLVGQRPTTIARLEPLARDTADLEPFAIWLIDHVRRARAADRPLRVWVPHGKTVETLGILGRRYETNPNASTALQEAARYCRILAEESCYAGQQTIVVALDALLTHIVTGQMPIEDQHLHAVLAWVNPLPGRLPIDVATERARWPASGILINSPDRSDDDRVERLRKELKGVSGPRRARIEAEIRRVLTEGVSREWELLSDARAAFWGLGLAAGQVAELVQSSHERVSWAVDNYLITPRSAVPIARNLEDHEHAQHRADDAAIRSDGVIRRRAARFGKVVDGIVQRVEQPQPNRHPCHIVLSTSQNNLRVRLDDRIALVGGSLQGVVRAVRARPGGTTLVQIELKSGVRGAAALLGVRQEWIDSQDFPLFLRHKSLSEAGARATWMVEGSPAPPPRATRVRAGDPLDLAHAARKRP